MSDARPITNITDFVCGSCWTGFSRDDAGVVQGDQLICPHCGTAVPEGDPDEQLAKAVINAPRVADRDSSEFRAQSFRDTSELAPAVSEQARGWLPPDQRSPRAPAESDDFDAGFGGGVLVGDPDHDFAVAESTLSGTQDNDDLLAAVRQTSPIPKAFIVGDELSIVSDEPTPVDISAMNDLDDPSALAASFEAPLPETDLAHRDWKLKAMGITYNFHGLDPLFSWAANKSGQPMSLSHDGEVWKDFHTFYASIRDGVSVKKAFENAPDPSNAPPPPATPRVTRTINQIRPELPELEGLRPPSESVARELGSTRSPSTTAALVSRAVTNPGNQAPRSGATVNNSAIQSGSRPSGSAIRAASTGNTARNLSTLSPSTSPSKKMPVATAGEKPMLTPPRIAALVVLALVLVAAGLHLAHIIKIPGLP